MYTILFNRKGQFHIDYYPEYKSVVSKDYCEVLKEVIKRSNHPNQRLILHHDGAGIHRSDETKEFLSSNNVEMMVHPPYSPDLAPNDFWMISRIKKYLAGKKLNEFTLYEHVVDLLKVSKRVTLMHVLTNGSDAWKNVLK